MRQKIAEETRSYSKKLECVFRQRRFMEYFYLSILGVIVGILAGFFGIGGGVLSIPALVFFGFGIKEAIGIAVMQMVFVSIFGSYLNHRGGVLDLKQGIILGLGGASGGFMSGFIVKSLPDLVIFVVFLLAMLFSIYRLYKPPRSSANTKEINAASLYVLGFGASAVGMCVGMGGAMFAMPILISFFGFDVKKTVPLGLFFVIFSSISGFISQSYNGLVRYEYGFVVGIFALVGVFFGLKLSSKIGSKRHKMWLLWLYIVVFFVMTFELLAAMQEWA